MKNYALFLLIAAAPAVAGTYSVPKDEPVVSVQIPENWKIKEHDEFIEGTTPDGTVHVLVLAVEDSKVAESMGEGVRYIRHIGGIVIKDGRGKTDSMTVKGKPVRSICWDGRDQKGEIKLRCHVVSGKAGKLALLFTWASVEADKKYERELTKVLQNIEAS